MANYIAGDITEIVCQHELGEFRFSPKANESFTLDSGGIRVNDDANQITGSGKAIYQKNRVRWSMEGAVAVDFASENETKNLPLLAEHPSEGTWTITHISGVIWRGRGVIVGDLQPDTNTAQMSLKVSGSGRLETI
jgi:hypothetical protein